MENSSIIKYLGITDEGLETSPDNFFDQEIFEDFLLRI